MERQQLAETHHHITSTHGVMYLPRYASMKEQIHLHGANNSVNQIISFLTEIFLSITWFQSLQFVCTVICENKDFFK